MRGEEAPPVGPPARCAARHLVRWHAAQRPRPPRSPAAEPAPRPAPVPAVNPNKNKYSGNLATGTYKQPKIAKGPGEPSWEREGRGRARAKERVVGRVESAARQPGGPHALPLRATCTSTASNTALTPPCSSPADGTKGFALPRPNAVMPPLPGLEPKPEPEAEAEAEEAGAMAAAEAAHTAEAPAAVPAAAPAPAVPAPAAAPAAAAAAAHPPPAKHHSGVHLVHHGPHPPLPTAAVAVPVRVTGGSGPPSRGLSPAGRLVSPTAAAAAALGSSQPSGAEGATSPSWQGGTPFSALAAMSLSDATVVEQGLESLKSGGGLHTHLSAEAPVFVPRVHSSGSLDKQARVAPPEAGAAQEGAAAAEGPAAGAPDGGSST